MTPTAQLSNAQTAPSRISILARLVPVFSYAIPMLGAALSAFLLMGVMEAMRNAESAGIAAVAGGMAEADLAITIALYLGVFVGFIGIVVMVIRSFLSTTTASPSAWFFLVAGGLGFVPMVLLWEAESLLIQAISPGYRGGIALVASTIQLCLTMTLITAPTFALILLVASLVPLPSVLRAKGNYAPLVVLVLMEVLLIGMAVAFQVRTSWFHQVGITEHF